MKNNSLYTYILDVMVSVWTIRNLVLIFKMFDLAKIVINIYRKKKTKKNAPINCSKRVVNFII